ncbi:MAG: AMP-binding protein [Raoultibacter sp.]
MIPDFEYLAKKYPRNTCFSFGGRIYTYAQVRLSAAGLAHALQQRGVKRRSTVVCDMENCPAFVFLALAAAYGGFSLVALNHRLTDLEKNERVTELERFGGVRVAARLTEDDATRLLEAAQAPDTTRTLSHYAQRCAAVFSAKERALVMFTSGTAGKPKAVALTWENLVGSAQASNAVLHEYGQGVWQLALPMYHIGGFQILVRSLCNGSSFVLYRRFDPEWIVCDGETFEATHLSVVDKMLQDLIAYATAQECAEAIARYQCILLGGAALNPHTLDDALALGARVYASYGMTETSSQMASQLVVEGFSGELTLLPGYEATIIAPEKDGVGQLAVKGPGVFSGYLNARAAFTVDGFFLTGDLARMTEGRLCVAERTDDMFVSGGENIYPAEIQEKLLRVAGVADAYVFGAPDEVWGRRPVAFVERSTRVGSALPSRADEDCFEAPVSLQAFAASVEYALEDELSRLYHPRCICALEGFPRTGIGKVDRAALRKLYDERLEVMRVEVFRVKQPLVQPIRTAKTLLEERESLLVRVTDHRGRTGLGECVAFSSDWYLPETIEDDVRVLEEQLIPQVLRGVYLHPDEVAASFIDCEDAARYPLACGALEPALWDLYGKIVNQPLWQLIGGVRSTDGVDVVEESCDQAPTIFSGNALDREVVSSSEAASFEGQGVHREVVSVPGGVVLGIASVAETLSAVQQAVDAGYTRVKIKICPGNDFEVLSAVRSAFPEVMLMADANQSYTEADMDILNRIDRLGLRCIEEPLCPHKGELATGPRALYARLAGLQRLLKTPICLDESVATLDDLREALMFPVLRCYTVKIAKLGGVSLALAFCRWAQGRNIEVWMGGMYDTGVSKRLHAAFQTLPGIDIPGDLNDSARYFPQDVTVPPFVLKQGCVMLNPENYEYGLGCDLDEDALARITVLHLSYSLDA